jgi:hypothetical protein
MTETSWKYQDDVPRRGTDGSNLGDQGIAQLDGIYTNGSDQRIELRDSTTRVSHRETCRGCTTVNYEQAIAQRRACWILSIDRLMVRAWTWW